MSESYIIYEGLVDKELFYVFNWWRGISLCKINSINSSMDNFSFDERWEIDRKIKEMDDNGFTGSKIILTSAELRDFLSIKRIIE